MIPTVRPDDNLRPDLSLFVKQRIAERQTATPNAPTKATSFWGDDGFSFSDILDIINPLQHIPIVSHLYREITGDKPAPAAKIIGGGLFGGALGLVSSAVNVAVEAETGKDILANAQALVLGDDQPTTVAAKPAPTQDSFGNSESAAILTELYTAAVSDVYKATSTDDETKPETTEQLPPPRSDTNLALVNSTLIQEALEKYKALKKAEYNATAGFSANY